MAKEGSVAPKERVNIVYKPATDGAKHSAEMLVADYGLGPFPPQISKEAASGAKLAAQSLWRLAQDEIGVRVGIVGRGLAVHEHRANVVTARP